MEQCDSKGCGAPAVFWSKCEAHLTPRERAVLELVRAADYMLNTGYSNKAHRLMCAIAAVKEVK